MGEEIAFQTGRISAFQGLFTLTLRRVILHTVMHHSSTSTYVPNFIEIKETLWTDRRTDIWDPLIRSTRRSRPNNWSLAEGMAFQLHKQQPAPCWEGTCSCTMWGSVASIHRCSGCSNTPIISAGGVHPYLNTPGFFPENMRFTSKWCALAKYIFVDLTIKTVFTTVYSLINCIALPCKSLIDYSIITDYSLHP